MVGGHVGLEMLRVDAIGPLVRGEAALGVTKPGQKLHGGTIYGRNGEPPLNSILFHIYDDHFLNQLQECCLIQYTCNPVRVARNFQSW